MQNVMMIQATPEELKSMIADAVKCSMATYVEQFKISQQDERLNTDQLAEYLGVSRNTVLNYARRKVVPFYKTGRTIYFKRSEVDQALASKRRGK